MTNFGFPYRIGPDGRTASATREAHVRGLIEQVLFTRQGERAMRPDFGAGVHELVFAENAPELAAAVQHMVQSALQRWLSDAIEVKEVAARANAERLEVAVRYRALDEAQPRVVTVTRQA
ncbi:GPW/gp25 family protein [Falsiroseomonas sp.]|uniref:GPW/gp25 family protein n=1 Tax=Falsiroseomonas sp. TaxID=2870721 RepID=UPI002733C016|nr:GPW/gp25 family protein [Falsiroseomonas sp.]MDP3417836.1 GPW/gp25 family protein [Falsiroseomonas sp.]